jgi:hypothetical protein
MTRNNKLNLGSVEPFPFGLALALLFVSRRLRPASR